MTTLLPTIFLVLTLSSLSLTVVKVFGGYSITLAFFAVLGYFFRSLDKIKPVQLFIFLLLTTFLLINAAVNASWIDGVHFSKSFGQTFFFLYCYITSFTVQPHQVSTVNYRQFVYGATALIVGFELLQVLQQLVMGSTSLWFLLDGISISTADQIERFEAVNLLGYFRPISFFHEPSYLGTVLFVLLVFNDRQINNKLVHFILIAAIVMTLSSTVFIFLIIYLLAGIIERRPRLAVPVALGFLFVVLTFSLPLISALRLDEFATEGTSAWVRLILPLTETIKILGKSSFGIPLGQSDFIFDNSFFLIICYFGVLTPLLVLAWDIALKNKLSANILMLRYACVFFCFLFLSGAIFTLESAVMSVLLNFAFFGEKASPC
jgi:hypothetical protein